MTLDMVDNVRYLTLVGSASCSTWVILGALLNLGVSFFRSFVLSFFCFLRQAPRSHFLADWDDLYAKTLVSGQGCAYCGFRQYLTTPKIPPQNGRKQTFSSIVKVKILHILKTVNWLAQNFMRFFGSFLNGLVTHTAYFTKLAAKHRKHRKQTNS